VSSETSTNFGDRLREERNRLGLTQTALGAIGGVRQQAQYLYEKGERKPDSDYLAAVAAAGVDVLYVLTGQRPPPPAPTPNGTRHSLLSADESRMLDIYRNGSDEGRAILQRATEAANTTTEVDRHMSAHREPQQAHQNATGDDKST